MHVLIRSALAAVLMLPLAAAPVRAAEPLTRDDVRAMIRSYILENPEIIEDALQVLEQRKAEAAKAAQAAALQEHQAAIFNSPNGAVLGNPKGKITVVEFFDYNCHFCKEALPDMLRLLSENKDIRFVLKEFPLLGPGSVEAAQVAVAINRLAPAKYSDFHNQLLGSKGEANKARALQAAASVGLTAAAIEAEVAKPAVNAALEESFVLANALNINGTPSYIIGDTIVPGAVGIDRLKAAISASVAAK